MDFFFYFFLYIEQQTKTLKDFDKKKNAQMSGLILTIFSLFILFIDKINPVHGSIS